MSSRTRRIVMMICITEFHISIPVYVYKRIKSCSESVNMYAYHTVHFKAVRICTAQCIHAVEVEALIRFFDQNRRRHVLEASEIRDKTIYLLRLFCPEKKAHPLDCIFNVGTMLAIPG
jgi:sulfatase maturation enzyme AslB (radical SAM superfamily)